MIKETTLLLGGEERKLRFGVTGFFKHVGDVYDGDPLDIITGVSNPKKQYEIILAIIYAGLTCAGSSETKETVDAWVQQLDFDLAADLINAARSSLIGGNGKVGETEARELAETGSHGEN